jgi:ribosomal protein S18 acetylase RimI-like enzyme
VAFLVATIEAEVPIYRLKEFGFIPDRWVEPAYRQLGRGKQLVEQMLHASRHKAVPQIRLDPVIENELARRLFESCSFRVSAIELLADINHKHD